MNKKPKSFIIFFSVFFLITLMAFILSTGGGWRDRKDGQEYVTIESYVVLGDKQPPSLNPWGRKKTINGFEYSKIPREFCFMFIGSLLSTKPKNNKELILNINGASISKDDPDHIEKLTEKCLKHENKAVISIQ